jgi:Tfp pilus assembly protein PilO
MNRNLNLEWAKRPAVFGTILATIVIALVWWFAWMTPQASKLSSINTQQSQAQGQVAVLQSEIAQLRSESSLLSKELPYLKFFESQIPSLPLQGQLTAQLYQLSLKTKTFISALSDSTVSPPSSVSGGYSTMPITIELTGTHNEVISFLQGLYSMQRLVTIQSVSLTPPSQQPNLNTNGTATGFGASIVATAYTTYVPITPAAPTTATADSNSSS